MDAQFIVTIAIVGLTALLAVLLGVLGWAMAMQRKALLRQGQSLYQVDESLELSRRGVEHSERLLRLAEESVANQEEMLVLLRELTGRGVGPRDPSSPAAGVRLPVADSPAPRELKRS
jgi:hypothetical protein